MNDTLQRTEPGENEMGIEALEDEMPQATENVEKPADPEAQTDAKIREQAEEETLAHFKKEASDVDAWLARPENIDVIIGISELTQPVSEESLATFSREHGLPSGMDDLLPSIAKSLESLRPIKDVVVAKDGIRKFIREKLSPSDRLADAMGKYDAGTSWYHSPEGKQTLERIAGDVKASTKS